MYFNSMNRVFTFGTKLAAASITAVYERFIFPVPASSIGISVEQIYLKRRDVVSVLNVSVSRRSRDVFWNVSSRLGLEDITSRSRSRDFSLVNIHAMHQVFGYITKKIMDLTRKKQVVK